MTHKHVLLDQVLRRIEEIQKRRKQLQKEIVNLQTESEKLGRLAKDPD